MSVAEPVSCQYAFMPVHFHLGTNVVTVVTPTHDDVMPTKSRPETVAERLKKVAELI